ncbi:MAG: hypothetical protein GX333_02180 [Syntrophomonadaceae bacterium]|nr:hypothetical protein [Syntrophomonadaceae bacterium]
MINKKGFRLLLALLISLCLIITIMPRVKTIMELSSRKQGLEEQKVILVEKHELLTIQLEEANSMENIERIAREQLGMVKEGEQMLIPVIPTK